MDSIVGDQLRNRRLSVLIADQPEQRVVDIAAGPTRSHIENALSIERTKIGDYIGRDLKLSRQTSRLFFDEKERGLVAPSAEHRASNTLAIFERHSTSGDLRVDLLATETHLALTLGTEISSAVAYLLGDDALVLDDGD